MTATAETTEQTLYQRIESKLGVKHLRSDSDLVTLVERRLPVQSVLSLTKHGLAEGEVYTLIHGKRALSTVKTEELQQVEQRPAGTLTFDFQRTFAGIAA
jgi:hypothetical protein